MRMPTRRKEADPIDILHLLDRLEETIRSGWHIPGMSRCAIDENEVQEIIESIRESIPEQMREADEVKRGREGILAEGKAEAERIIADAQAQALELVHEQVLYKTAEREARRIIEEANQQAYDTTDACRRVRRRHPRSAGATALEHPRHGSKRHHRASAEVVTSDQ